MNDTGGWFLIDIGARGRIDYGSISDWSHDSGNRLLGFPQGPWSLLPFDVFARASSCLLVARSFPPKKGRGNRRRGLFDGGLGIG